LPADFALLANLSSACDVTRDPDCCLSEMGLPH